MLDGPLLFICSPGNFFNVEKVIMIVMLTFCQMMALLILWVFVLMHGFVEAVIYIDLEIE